MVCGRCNFLPSKFRNSQGRQRLWTMKMQTMHVIRYEEESAGETLEDNYISELHQGGCSKGQMAKFDNPLPLQINDSLL